MTAAMTAVSAAREADRPKMEPTSTVTLAEPLPVPLRRPRRHPGSHIPHRYGARLGRTQRAGDGEALEAIMGSRACLVSVQLARRACPKHVQSGQSTTLPGPLVTRNGAVRLATPPSAGRDSPPILTGRGWCQQRHLQEAHGPYRQIRPGGWTARIPDNLRHLPAGDGGTLG
jgi:hypothetical protein